MSLAKDIVSRMFGPQAPVTQAAETRPKRSYPPRPADETVPTSLGPMRLNTSKSHRRGKIDGRNLQRGKPKPSTRGPSAANAALYAELFELWSNAQPGDRMLVLWRDPHARSDQTIRNREMQYLYNVLS